MAHPADAVETPAAPPHPELRRLDPLVGHWTASDRSIDGPGGPGAMVNVEESFRWLEGGFFLESRYTVLFGDPPAHHGVFRQIIFNDEGPFD